MPDSMSMRTHYARFGRTLAILPVPYRTALLHPIDSRNGQNSQQPSDLVERYWQLSPHLYRVLLL